DMAPALPHPLPTVAAELARVSEELEHGRGIVLLRGLPVARYPEDQIRALYWGLGTHLGTARFQNARGELIGEVRDEMRLYGSVQEPALMAVEPDRPRTSRSKARSSGPLRFHTDRADVVALLCVRPARAGGLSKVASSVAVHNEILARRPDLHALLCQDYHRNREGEEAGGELRPYAMPVFAVCDGRFTSHYSRTFVEAAQRLPEVPRLSRAQDEALDLLAEVAEELSVEMALEPGDIQLLNNHVIYHSRTAYDDDPAPGRDRLLLRLWLSVPNSRPLPEGFEVLWGATVAGALRGGIQQAH
ncbi:MAG: TauD/TfdA family dioxygenase, partial [Candidatus Rokubacteria bacterium]|nr:TauD/TfdA family dioxygenase [Candidatus Rokubacteria bacterium]